MRALKKQSAGFSLVELSIVLVILGLITGGILAGQSMIRAADLRSIMNDYNRFQTAIVNFKSKYKMLPGDFSKATDYWGTATGGCPLGARNGTETCNGNGNNFVTSDSIQEHFLIWQHLANAGLIEGLFTGVQGSGGVNHFVLGSNIPTSHINNVGWGVRSLPTPLTGYTNWFDNYYGDALSIGAMQTNSLNHGKAFMPEEASGIDRKMDDNLPGTGKLVVLYWSTCTTAAASSDTYTAKYKMSDSSLQCAIVFPKSF